MRGLLVGVCAAILLAAFGAMSWYTLARHAPPPVDDDDLGPVGDFSLVDQSGRTVTKADLLGKVWVASFIFTRCAGPCPQVSSSMAELNHELAGESDVLLVSFTVDPEHDTPAVLDAYASKYGADPRKWRFLTGRQETIYPLILESFHLAVEENKGPARTPGSEVTHSTRLVVVDRRGHVRGYFDGRRTDEQGLPVHDLPRLRAQIGNLLRERS